MLPLLSLCQAPLIHILMLNVAHTAYNRLFPCLISLVRFLYPRYNFYALVFFGYFF